MTKKNFKNLKKGPILVFVTIFFQNLTTIPSGRRVTEREERRLIRVWQNTVNSGHYILPVVPKDSERTSLRPKSSKIIENCSKKIIVMDIGRGLGV